MMKRSAIYASIADKLAQTCSATIRADGTQVTDEVHGELWDGTIFYSIGEMQRVRGVAPAEIPGADYVSIAHSLIEQWEEVDTLKCCFAAMGLAMLGPDGPEHPILGSLSESERAKVERTLRVTRAFPHNWEVFNASLRIGRSVLWGDAPELALPHIEKLVKKYEESGYFDDSENSGDYNNYGLMTINFSLRLSEFLPVGHPVRQQIEDLFRPHAMRYFELLKLFVGRNGEGWFFGRSGGVLGQLQCISFLEQILPKNWFSAEDAAWARCACRKLMQFLQDVFWDEEHQWYSFRDENRTCFAYRASLPMAWDLWRYFLQLENYASMDEAVSTDELEVLPCEPVCREIVTSKERNTTYLVWSDGQIKWQMPIMGAPTVTAGDNLPRPYFPGLFEWTTGNSNPPPVLCPRFTKDGLNGWPAWWPASTELKADGENWRYRVVYRALAEDHGTALDWPVSVVVDYHFGVGFFERVDRITVSEAVTFDSVRIEVLQGAPHPKSQNYPKVFTVNSAMQSNLPGIEQKELDVSTDPDYRNYFAHPVKSFILAGNEVELVPGEYEIRTEIRW